MPRLPPQLKEFLQEGGLLPLGFGRRGTQPEDADQGHLAGRLRGESVWEPAEAEGKSEAKPDGTESHSGVLQGTVCIPR